MSTDWQEIVVTVVAACALLVLVRPLVPYPLGPKRASGPSCANCTAGQAAARARAGSADRSRKS